MLVTVCQFGQSCCQEAFKEIDSLADVHQWAVGRMSSENVVIAGDLNAGGTFVKPTDWAKCRLRGEGYSWLIADHQDTTATNTLAAYDRQEPALEPSDIVTV